MTYRVVREPCQECPFKGRFELRPGRLRGLLSETRERDAVFVCHMSQVGDRLTTLNDGRLGYSLVREGGSAAVCAGWLEACKDWRPQVLQIAERLDLVSHVEPPR